MCQNVQVIATLICLGCYVTPCVMMIVAFLLACLHCSVRGHEKNLKNVRCADGTTEGTGEQVWL